MQLEPKSGTWSCRSRRLRPTPAGRELSLNKDAQYVANDYFCRKIPICRIAVAPSRLALLANSIMWVPGVAVRWQSMLPCVPNDRNVERTVHTSITGFQVLAGAHHTSASRKQHFYSAYIHIHAERARNKDHKWKLEILVAMPYSCS